MQMILYDFDGTIYDGDSSVDFFKYCLKHNKKIYKRFPKMILAFFRYKTKYINITECKEELFSFLNDVENIDKMVENFWKENEKKVKKFYLEKDHSNDIIISASPEFLLNPICNKLKVKDLIASNVDKHNGKFYEPNNSKEVKVKNFYQKYPKAIIKEMYSDSDNDKPLLDLAEKSYFVKKNKLYDYNTYKPNIFKRFWDFGWGIYHKNEELWNYLIIGALTTVVSVLSYALFSKSLNINYIASNVLSWIVAVLFAYFTNRWFVFHSKSTQKLKEFISFTASRVATLILDTLLMILFVEKIKLDDMIAKLIVQVVVVIGNYILSKLLVFKTNKKE